jgi:hypothetical protein
MAAVKVAAAPPEARFVGNFRLRSTTYPEPDLCASGNLICAGKSRSGRRVPRKLRRSITSSMDLIEVFLLLRSCPSLVLSFAQGLVCFACRDVF